ncbi:heteromeric transposase endonuclease subunit TnsA [Azospira restricta]|uniref:heteromeric transposase endonuclease subunit TnsA n=1 Tax=Azospira restricta TaxID=404405 RepID=UPI001EF04F93|nr:heteromeric transposase endonuclease subunit TnsA [Azospira restricta]
MPVPSQTRKIGPTRRSVSGVYVFRGEAAIPFESTLERDFLIRTEWSVTVLDVIPQPCRVPFVSRDGRAFEYTPDYLVYYRLGDRAYPDYPRPALVEVKPAAEWHRRWRDWLPKWKAAWRYAQQQGWSFHICDESRIRDQALTNIRFLDPYRRMAFPAEESRMVVETVRRMGSSALHYLLARHFMGIYRSEGVAHIWHLLATRRLDCDIHKPLTEFTELWVPTDESA